MNLSKNISINKHGIKLVKSKQPSYKPILSLNLVKMKMLKTYIKIYFKTRFIWSSRSLTSFCIKFDKEFDKRLWLCINHYGLNNLTIKNWYIFFLINKCLNQLNYVK